MFVMRCCALSIALLLAACEGGAGPSSAAATAEAAAGMRLGELQGSGPRSPFEGRSVLVQGVVTGNFVSGLDGFFMQDAAGEHDDDPATSDGVFVHWPRGSTPRVRRGDRVRVTGTVVERGEGDATLTVIEAVEVQPQGRGASAAVILEQAPESAADWERYEGMWLRIAVPLTLAGNDGLLRYGELVVSFGGRQFQPTERHAPGNQARIAQADNLRRRLVLDDNRRGDYPEKLWFLPEPLSPDAPLRVGSTLHEVEGVLEQRHGWRLQLTAAIGRIEQAPRPAPPELPDGLRIATFNLHNLFNGDGRGGGFPTERGASTLKELERQRDKLALQIDALAPDVAALMELENDGFDARSSLARLVDALNERAGRGTYAFVDAGEGPGRDAIRVGLIYRPERVVPQGRAVTLERGAFAEHNRVPLAQAFVARAGGPAFTVVANHFKSKGSCAEAQREGDRDAGDGQGCWNQTRREGALELAAWLARDPAASGSTHALVLGDLNAYAQEDPVTALRGAGWRDAFEVVGARRPYSYVWLGYSGRLDHVFVSESLVPFVAATRAWHNNADESEAFDYNEERRAREWYRADAYRASDHDPLVTVIDFARRK